MKIASSHGRMVGLRPNLHTMISRWARIQGVLKVKVKVTGLYDFTKIASSTLMAASWVLTKLSLSITFLSLCPFRFLPFPNLQMAVSSLCEFHNSSQFTWHTGSETVCQPFVKLFTAQYGLTFCLYMRSLYDPSLGPTLSFQTYTIRQLDLI